MYLVQRAEISASDIRSGTKYLYFAIRFSVLGKLPQKMDKISHSPYHTLFIVRCADSNHIEIVNYYADAGEWHPVTWFFSAEYRKLVKSEMERIKLYREKGNLL